MQPAPSPAVRWVGLLVVPLVLIALLVLAAEGIVRVRQWSKFGSAGGFSSLYFTDERIGLRVLKPDMHIGRISTNAFGFRGPAIAQPKPYDTIRLAFLGASTTYCAEVSGESQVWPALVTDALRLRFPSAKFDFVNGGVPGYTVASSRKNLANRIAALQPDVIVVYHATNDLSGEVNRLAAEAGLRGNDFGQSWLERHSLLWELVVKNLRVWRATRRQSDGAGRLHVQAEKLGREFHDQLSGLLREAQATGAARVAIATFSTHLRPGQTPTQQERAAVSALVYMPFMTYQGLLDGFARYNAIVREVAGAEAALLIDGEDTIPGDSVHFVDSVHFSDAGSQAMAKRVAEALASDVVVQELVATRKHQSK